MLQPSVPEALSTKSVAPSRPTATSPPPSTLPQPLATIDIKLRNADKHVPLEKNAVTPRLHWRNRINKREVEPANKLPPSQRPCKSHSGPTSSLTSTNTLLSSTNATFFPKHPYLPLPNTNSTDLSILCASSPLASNHLSGRNTAASSPNVLVL